MEKQDHFKPFLNFIKFIFQVIGFMILGTLKVIGVIFKVIGEIIETTTKKK